MASSSNTDASARTQEDPEYSSALNCTVSNFVSVKLSGERNYHIWEMQMLCLLESYNMQGVVYAAFNRSIRKQHDSLVKGWIFGSISEELLGTVVGLGSAKDVWKKLESIYCPTMINSQQEGCADSAQTKLEVKTESIEEDAVSKEKEAEDIDVVSGEIQTEDNDAVPTKTIAKETETQDKDAVPVEKNGDGEVMILSQQKQKLKREGTISAETDIKGQVTISTETETKGINKIERNKNLCKAVMEWDWWALQAILTDDKDAVKERINSDGNTVLHIAVGIGRNFFVSEILSFIKGEQLPEMVNDERSTALHIAAIVGNTEAAKLLIKKNKSLLEVPDSKGETPLAKAYENMHLDTIEYLLKSTNDDWKTKNHSPPVNIATNDDGKTKKETSPNPGVKIGVSLLVNAVSSKQYDLATKLVEKYPEFALEDNKVLMAIARTFPSGLDYGETLIYPIMGDITKRIVNRTKYPFILFIDFYEVLMEIIHDIPDDMKLIIKLLIVFMLMGPYLMFSWIYHFILLLMLMVYFPLFTFYLLLWKLAAKVVKPIKHIEKKKKDWEEANRVLKLVCDGINKLQTPDAHSRYYTKPLLEAARQNAYEVVEEILMRSPEAIRYKDESGYDIIQLAVIHRSEKVYNLIYTIGERKSVYRTVKDSAKNNMLHLAGRLAPSQKLKRSIGAAFQLQRELQWRQEVKKLVFPAYITKENIFKETPDMVFTREHENLVKEGEKWMKAVAESCSITAGLITTIVFAAAITVPGGIKQESGIPLFIDNIAFTIFAVSDAMSLFASSTALLMFLSILTGRFSEQDFLHRLPRRMIIGLVTLLLSTTAMMVAFGTTLYLVFCYKRPWMVAPICVLAFLPIAAFSTLKIPIIVDLFRSTYVHIFGKQSNNSSRGFNPNDIRLYFGK